MKCLVCSKDIKSSQGYDDIYFCTSCDGYADNLCFYKLDKNNTIIDCNAFFTIDGDKYHLHSDKKYNYTRIYNSTFLCFNSAYKHFNPGELVPFCERILKLKVFL